MTVKQYYVADMEFDCAENPIVLGDGKCLYPAPYDFEILEWGGCILHAGTGAGTATQIQIRNVTRGGDYFSTRPEFRVNDADVNGRAVLAGGVLGTRITGKAGDVLALDVDGLPGGADSGVATVWLTCGFWREV